ncbi:hypothetical protein [Marinobacter pelagius]|uniref:Uncharacterized protein n=1 Tax=Marinobacter pelagius TaxID=379482 RepID=A0A1I4S0S5_9GAMM|nr:hypothetical protein [Marinobacter pelagius]SFM58085.1 hypothetical protein SAMN04487961_0776 [Marinobacter pelagius]
MPDQSPVFLRIALITTVMALFGLFSAGSHAESLSDQKISSFIESLKAAQKLEPEFEELDDQMDAEDDGAMPDFSRLFSDSLDELKGHEAYNRLDELARNHGFDNIEQWAATGDRVYQAWMAIEMEQQSPGARQEMNAALAEIENNPQMTAEQKAQMRAMMESAMGAMESASNAPAGDVEAVRPHLDALRAISE